MTRQDTPENWRKAKKMLVAEGMHPGHAIIFLPHRHEERIVGLFPEDLVRMAWAEHRKNKEGVAREQAEEAALIAREIQLATDNPEHIISGKTLREELVAWEEGQEAKKEAAEDLKLEAELNEERRKHNAEMIEEYGLEEAERVHRETERDAQYESERFDSMTDEELKAEKVRLVEEAERIEIELLAAKMPPPLPRPEVEENEPGFWKNLINIFS
jgi:hypothetical protein